MRGSRGGGQSEKGPGSVIRAGSGGLECGGGEGVGGEAIRCVCSELEPAVRVSLTSVSPRRVRPASGPPQQ